MFARAAGIPTSLPVFGGDYFPPRDCLYFFFRSTVGGSVCACRSPTARRQCRLREINTFWRAQASSSLSFFACLFWLVLTLLSLHNPSPHCCVLQDALDRANEVMGSSLTQRDVKIHVVRDVAPNKPMLCLSFVAPDAGGAPNNDPNAGGTGKVQSVGSDAVPTPAEGAAGPEGGAAERTTCSGGSEAVEGGCGTGGADAVVASGVGVDDRERAGMEVEGSDGGASKKRPRTAAVPENRG